MIAEGFGVREVVRHGDGGGSAARRRGEKVGRHSWEGRCVDRAEAADSVDASQALGPGYSAAGSGGAGAHRAEFVAGGDLAVSDVFVRHRRAAEERGETGVYEVGRDARHSAWRFTVSSPAEDGG